MNTHIIKKISLHPDLFTEKIEMESTRDGFGIGLVEAGKKYSNVVVLCADVEESTRVLDFKEKFPDRFIEVGVAEQNMAGVATGLAQAGKIPVMASYAAFSPGRNWDQIRVSICYNNANVKIVSTHSGLNVGQDGATHQALEDIALMRVLPQMTVVVPCDALEAGKAINTAIHHKGPVYVRLTRDTSPVMTTKNTHFQIGEAQMWRAGKDATIVGCGPILFEALLAARELACEDIAVSVINMATIKPLDRHCIIQCAQDTGAIVTVEEHQIYGGLGSAVAEVLAQYCPAPIEFVGVRDCFGESGTPDELLTKYGLKKGDIIKAVKKVIRRK